MADDEGKINGKFPIFNDALAFLYCKMDVVPKDTLIATIKNFYVPEDLIIARDLFSKVIQNIAALNQSKRLMQRNAETIIASIYDIMQSAGKDILPPFVAQTPFLFKPLGQSEEI